MAACRPRPSPAWWISEERSCRSVSAAVTAGRRSRRGRPPSTRARSGARSTGNSRTTSDQSILPRGESLPIARSGSMAACERRGMSALAARQPGGSAARAPPERRPEQPQLARRECSGADGEAVRATARSTARAPSRAQDGDIVGARKHEERQRRCREHRTRIGSAPTPEHAKCRRYRRPLVSARDIAREATARRVG